MSTIERPFIIGITGGSASGKTLFLSRLMEQFRTDDICLLSQDNYYRPIEHQTKDHNGIENFDLPGAIDDQAFAADIERLRNGEVVSRVEYTFNNTEKVPDMLHFHPRKILVVEGIFVFHFPEVAQLLDLKIFIDARDKIKLKRRIKRDNEERGYDLQDVMYRWKYHVKPTYEEFIRPHKRSCDIVIPNNQHFEKGLDVIVSYLKNQI
ncbi:uridine kinase [Aquirufa antheringensis]|jgi:uridine kinase|uniref:uridine/cytidine kinase n=1 Tax=Aquirufa antheringensis TaxID=2516559 RepID=A0A4Q9BFA0_9BACT|nr:uridine kinase [Aquirufa antheringensis]MCE4217079.1 uridine kinase [Pseudarcicella sp. GAP-15]MCL9968167.1 uridine kinase [Aquirufa antheringensis]MCZ2478320.1 uridine kinase [Aquirufa antheringensis]MCZ2484331.1 uridine kinase [Aquirufa antheringensis]MCZ2487800.1 uridine kinase [Aquirufa antheringensis]